MRREEKRRGEKRREEEGRRGEKRRDEPLRYDMTKRRHNRKEDTRIIYDTVVVVCDHTLWRYTVSNIALRLLIAPLVAPPSPRLFRRTRHGGRLVLPLGGRGGGISKSNGAGDSEGRLPAADGTEASAVRYHHGAHARVGARRPRRRRRGR